MIPAGHGKVILRLVVDDHLKKKKSFSFKLDLDEVCALTEGVFHI